MTTEYRPIADYPKNELNKTNTFEDSGIVEFLVGDVKFAMGFWGSPYQDKDHPYLALISWTPDGWVVVGRLPPLWNDALGMEMQSNSEDLRQYAWYIGNAFTPKMQKYITDTGGAPVSLKNWQKIRMFLNSVKIVNGEIIVSHE